MVLKVDKKLSGERLYLLIAFAILVILIGAITLVNHNNKPKEAPKNTGYTLPNYDYTYQSSDVSCKVVPSYPGAATTINYCTGKLVVTNKDAKTQTLDVTFTSIFYKNGAVIPLDQLNSLVPGKSKVAIKYFDKEQKQLKSVTYVQ